ncbi:PhnE/PtxC family ABC transporter permease [Actinospongicola halichondriae]|uniref:PhnE/PtxC family ABC transporter permease n=1 Tax=Actinospongicola halichondriae TaxID=3236844 RepID=UPI003D459DBF
MNATVGQVVDERARASRRRRLVWAVVCALVVGSAIRAGDPTGSFNAGGLDRFGDFFEAALSPELSSDFLGLTWDESLVTLAYALLGTALAVAIGLVGGVLLSRRWWEPPTGGSVGAGWRVARAIGVVPRSVHEVVWGLLLLNILGLDPIVAVLAIGIPFGAITATVFADVIDERDAHAYRALRSGGAGRLTAIVYSLGPDARADLTSYAFYRFECSIRSAAILGIVGAGGLGFQLQLSFTSLHYDEVWTLLYALILLSGLADAWSGWVRRRTASAVAPDGVRTAPPGRRSASVPTAGVLAVAVPLAWWRVGLDPSTLWSERSRGEAEHIVGAMWPPALRDGWGTLLAQCVDTILLAVLAMVLAFVVGAGMAFVASGAVGPRGIVGAVVRPLTRLALLVTRAIPAPVGAIVALFVMGPGPWTGAVALGIYNVGVLGRLFAEVVENADDAVPAALVAQGATRAQAVGYATVPDVWGRLVALGLYRWEVAIRETVVVGVVGAGGLGRALDDELSAFAWSKVSGIALSLIAVTFVVDLLSGWIRRNR